MQTSYTKQLEPSNHFHCASAKNKFENRISAFVTSTLTQNLTFSILPINRALILL